MFVSLSVIRTWCLLLINVCRDLKLQLSNLPINTKNKHLKKPVLFLRLVVNKANDVYNVLAGKESEIKKNQLESLTQEDRSGPSGQSQTSADGPPSPPGPTPAPPRPTPLCRARCSWTITDAEMPCNWATS